MKQVRKIRLSGQALEDFECGLKLELHTFLEYVLAPFWDVGIGLHENVVESMAGIYVAHGGVESGPHDRTIGAIMELQSGRDLVLVSNQTEFDRAVRKTVADFDEYA